MLLVERDLCTTMYVSSLLYQPIEGQRGLVDEGEERGSSPVEWEYLEQDEVEGTGPPPSLCEPVAVHSEGKAMQQMFTTL